MQSNEKDKSHTKKRVSKACDCCRKSKTKCDGQRPCTRCLQDGKICTYMNKKKADQMYPASYVDLLETRVSILVQSLNQLLNKSKLGFEQFEAFCSDPEILNDDEDFDINKVICKLLPNEKLDNLAESSEKYSIDDITHVTDSPASSSTTSSKKSAKVTRSNSYESSPCSSATSPESHNHSNHHYSLSKVRRNSDNHVHKCHNKKHGLSTNLSNSSLVSSFQTKFNVSSPDTYIKGSNSLDITNQPKKFDSTLDFLLYSNDEQDTPASMGLKNLQDLELDSIDFSDSNPNSTPISPIHPTDDPFMLPNQLQQLASPVGVSPDSAKNNGVNTWGAMNDTSNPQIKLEDPDNNMGFNWALPQFGGNNVPVQLHDFFD